MLYDLQNQEAAVAIVVLSGLLLTAAGLVVRARLMARLARQPVKVESVGRGA